jgi:hypothetical protein
LIPAAGYQLREIFSEWHRRAVYQQFRQRPGRYRRTPLRENGPPGSSTSVLNNGTYKLGYKILSADHNTVVYSPPNNGLRYQFDRKPTGDVHNTFHPRSPARARMFIT